MQLSSNHMDGLYKYFVRNKEEKKQSIFKNRSANVTRGAFGNLKNSEI